MMPGSKHGCIQTYERSDCSDWTDLHERFLVSIGVVDVFRSSLFRRKVEVTLPCETEMGPTSQSNQLIDGEGVTHFRIQIMFIITNVLM